jgi:hypothetical protein
MCERKAKQFSFHLHIIPSQDRNADTKQSKEKKISMQQRINFASHCWDKWNAFINCVNCLTFKKKEPKNHDYSVLPHEEKISTMLENRDNRTFSLKFIAASVFANPSLPFLVLFFRSLPQPRWPIFVLWHQN